MKKLTVLIVFSVALLTLLAPVGPAFARQPKLTFDNSNISYPDPNHPGTQFTKDSVLHIRDQGSTGQVFGSPWGIIDSTGVANAEIYLNGYTGSSVSHGSYTCEAGSYDGTGTAEFTGISVFTYHGQQFTAITNTGGTFEVTDGTKFLGVIYLGQWAGHGTIDGKGMQMRVAFTGVSIISTTYFDNNHGLAGDNLMTGTTTYWFTG